MIRCQACGAENLDNSRFCHECGTKLAAVFEKGSAEEAVLSSVHTTNSGVRSGGVTSFAVPMAVEPLLDPASGTSESNGQRNAIGHAKLIIERGGSANTEFLLTAEESNIGRWDADNGIFPDVDLDAHDADAKVSRRHARIVYRDGQHRIEDLGSTNGTFINRGRRLIPGSPQNLNEGDEIIVGKTFLRFHINN